MDSVKFTFDTSFDDGDPQLRNAARARKTYRVDEIEAIRAASYAEGKEDGTVRAGEALAASVTQLAAGIRHALAAMDADVEVIRAEAARLAFSAAKQLAGHALDHAPEAEIAEVLRIAMHQAIAEPRMTIRIAPPLLTHVQARASEIAAREGYEGRMQFVPEPALRGANCRIEWRGGGIERCTETIETALSELVARRFSPHTKE